MHQFHIILAVGGGIILVLGLVSGFIKNRLWISEPLVCLAVGAALRPALDGAFDPASSPDHGETLLRETARVTLAVAVTGAALRLPAGYLRENWRSLAVILGLGMPLMWLAAGLLAWLLLPVSALVAMLIGAILAPTDPVLAASVVTGKAAERWVPDWLRLSLSAESGANDGLGLLLVMLPVLLLTRPEADAIRHWATVVLIWEIAAAVLIGGAVGRLAGHCLRWARRQEFSEQTSILTVVLALSLTVLGAVRLMGSDGILAAFAAGLAINGFLAERPETRQEHIQEAMGRFFDLPVFLLIGLMLPWPDWLALGWPLAGFAGAVLLLRRLPFWIVLHPFLPALRTPRDALFAGWFGPIGVAAVFYAMLGVEKTGMTTLWTVASAVVVLSVVLHGVSATILSEWFGRAREDTT